MPGLLGEQRAAGSARERDKGTRQRAKSVSRWQNCAALVGVVLGLVSCTSWPATYLRQATRQASMAEVAHHLGPPQDTWNLHGGETLWTYRSGVPLRTEGAAGIRIVGPDWLIGRLSDCDAYVLLFDQHDLLQAWRRQACSLVQAASPATKRLMSKASTSKLVAH
jgi:hypothetical protein